MESLCRWSVKGRCSRLALQLAENRSLLYLYRELDGASFVNAIVGTLKKAHWKAVENLMIVERGC
jgi:hypothetical protein